MTRLRLWPLTLILSAMAGLATRATAEVRVTPKHLLIIREGMDTLYGSYIFALQNSGETPEAFKTPVTLPQEKDDWIPQEGLEPSEVVLSPTGGLIVEKTVEPGVNLLGIGFKVPASFGHAKLTLKPETDIESMTVLLPRGGSISLDSARFKLDSSESAPDPQYVPWQSIAPLKAGEEVVIDITGLPEGRTRLWILGGVVAAMLLGLAGFLAWRTRPKITTDGAQSVLVG